MRPKTIGNQLKGIALAIGTTIVLFHLSGCGGSGSSLQATTPSPAGSGGPTVAELTTKCESLRGQVIAGVTVTATSRVAPISGVSTAGICKVSGTRAPFLDIEVDVPDNWSGRYFQNGGGGFDGTIYTAYTFDTSNTITAINPAITKYGAVYAASNGGNRAAVPAEAAPAVWLTGTTQAQASITDYAYLSIGTTTTFAKAVINAFYGKAPTKSYFNGCSNGGREGYIAAQRWPDQFDGIVAGCETEDMAGQTAKWLQIGGTAGTTAALTNAQYTASYQAAVAACDSSDGLADGYLTNAAACHFSPALLQCGLSTANPNPALCLSAAQVTTLQKYLSPMALSDGTVIYSGFNWSDYSAFGGAFGSLGGVYAFLATGDQSWLTPARQAAFNPDTDYGIIGLGLKQIGIDNDVQSIAQFVASGKKLISWHDIGDNLLSPNEHVRNDARMTAIARTMGLSDPTTNTRLFLVPSNTHGAGQDVTQIDWPGAIIKWVEQGDAPTQLTYTFRTSATASRSLPVCLYPRAPHYNGSGDITSATNYTCT
jgi:feruloyl esterase